MITITENAKKYLYEIAKKNNKKFVSFGVSGGGCDFFRFANGSYKWDYIDPNVAPHINDIYRYVKARADGKRTHSISYKRRGITCSR